MTYDEMRLRDHFAGLAMQAMIHTTELSGLVAIMKIAGVDNGQLESSCSPPIDIAEFAYRYADLMLSARRPAADATLATDVLPEPTEAKVEAMLTDDDEAHEAWVAREVQRRESRP